MSATILKFPRRKKVPPTYPKPRKRVFYAGFRYTGPALCQDVQSVYLKRHGSGEWSLIFYFEGRSWEIERFTPIDVPYKLQEYDIHEAPEWGDLLKMGWFYPDATNVEHIAYYQEMGFD